MKNDLSQIIFYLDLKHVHKYGSAKLQPNPLFSSQQMGSEHADGRKKKSLQTHRGSRRDGMPKLTKKKKKTTWHREQPFLLMNGQYST